MRNILIKKKNFKNIILSFGFSDKDLRLINEFFIISKNSFNKFVISGNNLLSFIGFLNIVKKLFHIYIAPLNTNHVYFIESANFKPFTKFEHIFLFNDNT